MNVALTTLSVDGHLLCEIDIAEKIYFLIKTLNKITFIQNVYLVDCGLPAGATANVQMAGQTLALISQADAFDLVDVVIEMAGPLDAEWTDRFRSRGGKVCHFVCQQPFAGLIEASVFGARSLTGKPGHYDAVWYHPADADFAPMLRSLYRCAAIEVPFVWASDFIDHARSMAPGIGMAGSGYVHGRLTQTDGVRVAIFEPNCSPTRSGLMGLLACEAVEAENPSAIREICFLNSEPFQDHHTFSFMARNFAVGARGKIRPDLAETYDLIISHQHTSNEPGMHYAAIHGLYPLVHNFPKLKDIGYYYSDCDMEAAAGQFFHACAHHDSELSHYQARSQAAIRRVDPQQAANLQAYARQLIALEAQAVRVRG